MSGDWGFSFDDFFEPDDVEADAEYFDAATLQKFQRSNLSIEKIQKDIFSFETEDDGEIYGEKATRKFEFQIQVSRILQIFDEMIKKIETLFCIQAIAKDEKLMRKHFHEDDIKILNDLLMVKNEEDLNLSDERENDKIYNIIQLILNSSLYLHTDKYKQNISFQKKIFLTNIKELRNIINSRLQLTAPKEMRKEQLLHQMWKKYEKTKSKIELLKEKWTNRKLNFEEKLSDKYAAIDKYKKEIESLKVLNEVEIQDKIQNSNSNMVRFCKNKDIDIENVYAQAESAKESYSRLLNENLLTEKELRDKKTKAIQTLQTIVNKYDNEIGSITKELELLTSALEKQKAEFSDWKINVCEPQEKLYAELMEEKEEDERRQQQESMMLFMMNRSAKILQKYWRTLCARRKKKGKRGRGRRK